MSIMMCMSMKKVFLDSHFERQLKKGHYFKKIIIFSASFIVDDPTFWCQGSLVSKTSVYDQ